MWILKIPLPSPLVKVDFFPFKTACHRTVFSLSETTLMCSCAHQAMQLNCCKKAQKPGLQCGICMQGSAELCSPALLLPREVTLAPSAGYLWNAGDTSTNTVGKSKISDILGWFFLFCIQLFHVWKAEKLPLCCPWWFRVRVGVRCPPSSHLVQNRDRVCISWFSWAVTEALCALERSVTCPGFVGMGFYASIWPEREYFHPVILQQWISYKNMTHILLSLPAYV